MDAYEEEPDKDYVESSVIGQIGEKTITNYLLSKGLEYISSNKDNKYDIKMSKNNTIVTYEIKTDVKIAPNFDSGNIFIEYSCRGKDSGITVTIANWFVMYLPLFNEAWFIKPNKLKELIKNNDFKISLDSGDYKSNTHGYLIPRKEFEKHFIIEKIDRVKFEPNEC